MNTFAAGVARGTLERMNSAILAAALAGCVFVQAGQPDAPLRGPRVPDREVRTLVRYTMEGGFQRIEGRPEVAAVALLDLDAPTRERAAAVGTDRGIALGLALVDHIDTVKEITDAIGAGERERATELLRGVWRELDGEPPARDPLLKPLGEVLTPEQHAEVTRLVEEYWGAWMRSEAGGRAPVTPEERAALEDRLAFTLFSEEIREAYERTLQPYRQRLEALYAALEPTDEQRQAIRTVFIDFIRRTRLAPTPQDRRAAVREIYDLLDEDRRGKLFDLVVRQLPLGE